MSEAIRDVIVMGASTGIGHACYREFLSRGWRVLACLRQPESIVLSADNARSVALDVVSVESIHNAAQVSIEWSAGASGPVGIVNAIGVGAVTPVELTSMTDYRELFDVNVFGPMTFVQALMPSLRRRGGCIVHVGSTSSRIPSPLTGAYSATKAALEALVACQRLELAGSNIRITLLQPGVVKTPFWSKLRAQEQPSAKVLRDFGYERYERLLGRRDGTEIMAKGSSPSCVAREVADLFEIAKPRGAYTSGADAWRKLLVKRILPESWFERLQVMRLR